MAAATDLPHERPNQNGDILWEIRQLRKDIGDVYRISGETSNRLSIVETKIDAFRPDRYVTHEELELRLTPFGPVIKLVWAIGSMMALIIVGTVTSLISKTGGLFK